MNNYIGHPSQIYGIEEHRLCGGKGDGMRLLEVNNGNCLMFTVSADRCGDISRLRYKGINLGYFAPCGYVSPKYYDNKDIGFLKSFTAGFLTTCGLTAVGTPCTDDGEVLPLHGTISNTPAENLSYFDGDKLFIKLIVRDASLFAHKLVLTREIECSLEKNEIILRDSVKNIGSEKSPYMILYHINIGFPLLSEDAVVTIPNDSVTPRNEHAAEGIKDALKMENPQPGFEEQCYYYNNTDGFAKIYNPDLKIGLKISYDVKKLPCFTEWKMMGCGEYVLGLEPGNCTPDGRDILRKNGMLKFLKLGEETKHQIKIEITEE